MNIFILNHEQHEIYNIDCPVCELLYPLKCSCGGLIHGAIGKNNYDYDRVFTKCENCGKENEYEL